MIKGLSRGQFAQIGVFDRIGWLAQNDGHPALARLAEDRAEFLVPPEHGRHGGAQLSVVKRAHDTVGERLTADQAGPG